MPHIGTFDFIIFGFCLYLVDRDDLPFIVAETTNCMEDDGVLAIHDFKLTQAPIATPYIHSPGLYSYKMSYPMLWLADPSYVYDSVVATDADTEISFLVKKGWERFTCES